MAFLNPLLLFGHGGDCCADHHPPAHEPPGEAGRLGGDALSAGERREEPEADESRGSSSFCLCAACSCILLALALARPVFRGRGAAVLEEAARPRSLRSIIPTAWAKAMAVRRGSTWRGRRRSRLSTRAAGFLGRRDPFFRCRPRGRFPSRRPDLHPRPQVVRDAALFDRAPMWNVVSSRRWRRSAPPRQTQPHLSRSPTARPGWNQFDDITKMLATPRNQRHPCGRPEGITCVSDLRLASSMASVGEAAQFDVGGHQFRHASQGGRRAPKRRCRGAER